MTPAVSLCHPLQEALLKSTILPIAIVCMFAAGCSSSIQQPSNTSNGSVTQIPAETDHATLINEFPLEPHREIESQKNAWNYISQTSEHESARNANLLNAAIVLVRENRISEAETIAGLIHSQQLTPSRRVEQEILSAQFLQAKSQHRRAQRRFRRILNYTHLNPNQRIRATKLRIDSLSYLNEHLDLVSELITLYSLLPNGSEQASVGNRLWKILHRLSVDELVMKLSETQDPTTQEWLRLVLGTHGKRFDPYTYNSWIQAWQQLNPEHPANQLIQFGSSSVKPASKLAVLLPLTSKIQLPARAFLAGVQTQHAADSNPDKPELQVVDIGDSPTDVTQHYYTAINQGASFVIGPLGIQYVTEMAEYGDFIVDTLLLGNPETSELPSYVYQFALAPEEEGVFVARRAWSDGYSNALILNPPTNWAKRTVDGFRSELERLGGTVIQSQEFALNKIDYSDSIENIFNVNASVKRHQEIKDAVGKSLKFTPRRRQDADFVFLVADSEHGRLIKPQIDFLYAHNLPVYSTSHILNTELNKIKDQDLNGVRFPELDWLIDKSESMLNLQSKIASNDSDGYERIFAMGVDSYNLISQLAVLRDNPDARFHGVTSTIALDQERIVVRTPSWAQFQDGTPELMVVETLSN